MNKKMFYNKKITSFFILLFVGVAVFFSFNYLYAQGLVPDGLTKVGEETMSKKDAGAYTLNDFIRLAVNIANWILGITGSLALLAFIWGGVLFLISAGSSDKVNQAKQIITGAIIGTVVVFVSYTVIGFAMRGMGFKQDNFGGQWYEAPVENSTGG